MTTLIVKNEHQAWLDKRDERREKRKTREFEKPKLVINSLMDAFVIILCFLLKQFGSDPVQIRESDQLQLPSTTSERPLEDAIVIGISKNSIQVNDQKVLDLRNGFVDESQKRDGSGGMLIIPLHQALQEQMSRLNLISARTNRPDTNKAALVVADKGTRYRLISEVLYTAGQAQFQDFRFVATEGGS